MCCEGPHVTVPPLHCPYKKYKKIYKNFKKEGKLPSEPKLNITIFIDLGVKMFRKKSWLINLLVNKSVLKRILNIAFPSNYLTVSINYFVFLNLGVNSLVSCTKQCADD